MNNQWLMSYFYLHRLYSCYFSRTLLFGLFEGLGTMSLKTIIKYSLYCIEKVFKYFFDNEIAECEHMCLVWLTLSLNWGFSSEIYFLLIFKQIYALSYRIWCQPNLFSLPPPSQKKKNSNSFYLEKHFWRGCKWFITVKQCSDIHVDQ